MKAIEVSNQLKASKLGAKYSVRNKPRPQLYIFESGWATVYLLKQVLPSACRWEILLLSFENLYGTPPSMTCSGSQELDVIIFLFFLSLALLRFCKNRRTDTVQLLK